MVEQGSKQTKFLILLYVNLWHFFNLISQQVELFSTDGFPAFPQLQVWYPATLHRKTDAREIGGISPIQEPISLKLE